ncbi:SulP family inorganic anion transporter [Natroniella sulfidigena]|uniref:SulP family inorganic anion transporter n=1 Tax=Natroniella sulfidigena TaxID=723921 RepID=UPI00200B3827|nr:SulP family inorganic anion transporter [Natroniella sulfidigena]MCK8815773.1 SulP family inorganic anion transporter [Natroniella sulfidigena]
MSLNLPDKKGLDISDFSSLIKNDLPASLVTFLVALPLSLGIALASGAPLMAGIIAAIVGGIVVGTLGGAPLQVSGPAAGLSVIIFGFVQELGWGVTAAMTVGAGISQIIIGKIGLAPIALAISPAVIHGMMAAIGILIAISQIHVVFGVEPVGKGIENLFDIPNSVMNLNPEATFLGVFTIIILIVWSILKPKRLRNIPGSLVAVVVATIISIAFSLDVPRVELAGSLIESISLPVLPSTNFGTFIAGIVVLTLVASAESLLSAVATDKLHSGPRCCLNKELTAQGIGNTISGLLGGLPITGVIIRSKANISSGAKTRLSAILHGVWVLIFVVFLPDVIILVPLASLAGLLVYIGIGLVNINHIKELKRYDELVVYFITVFAIVGIDLLVGLVIGFMVALIRLLLKFTRLNVNIENQDDQWQVSITGTLTCIEVPKLTTHLNTIPPDKEVKINLALRYLDHAGYEALKSWQESYEKIGGRVVTNDLVENKEEEQTSQSAPLVNNCVIENVWAQYNK